MRKTVAGKDAFTLIELLVVVVIIAILAALLFLAIGSAKNKARRTVCLNNLEQIVLGIHMYLDDQSNGSPGNSNAIHSPFLSFTDYRQLVGIYINIKGPASPQDKVFACPADTFFYDLSQNGGGYVPQPLHDQTNQAFTSYAFNAGQFSTATRTNAPAITNYYGIAGQRLETVSNPSTTVLVAEMPAFAPYSWHEPKRPFSSDNAKFNDAKNVIGFVDGHASYHKIYYDGKKTAWAYNPPAGYEYKWSGD